MTLINCNAITNATVLNQTKCDISFSVKVIFSNSTNIIFEVISN